MKLKAQSAIEYLITYGWMLLVVGIVSGVAYSLIDTSCREGVSGYTAQKQTIDQFGTGEDFLGIGIKNTRTEMVYINEITVTDVDTGANRIINLNTSLSPGGFNITLLPMAESDCNTYDFRLGYNISTLQGQYSSGKLTVEGDLVDVIPPPTLQSFTANY